MSTEPLVTMYFSFQAFSAGVVASSVAYIATRTNTNAPLTTKPRVRPKYEKTTRLLSETKSRRFNRLFSFFRATMVQRGTVAVAAVARGCLTLWFVMNLWYGFL